MTKLLVVIVALLNYLESAVSTNELGYVVYCPCMGRFGNQAEQLLGTLLFAKSINRTLVLPPFIHYEHSKPRLLRFDQVLRVEPIKAYHHVITMESFMSDIAQKIWPEGQRTFFCYSPKYSKNKDKCNSQDGEPFNTFWASFDIKEDSANFYYPLTTSPNLSHEWQRRYPSDKWPVLAFLGAPAPFPTYQESIRIQEYVEFSETIAERAKNFQQQRNFWHKPYIAIHLRHGSDWKNACDLLKEGKPQGKMTQLFSSAQCTGYGELSTPLSYQICLPGTNTIINSLKDTLSIGKSSKNITTVYVATDKDDMDLWRLLVHHVPQMTLITPSARYSPNSGWTHNPPTMAKPTPIIDAYILTYANIFVGNCISSFSAFAARIRSEQLHLSTSTYYLGWKARTPFKKVKHFDEL